MSVLRSFRHWLSKKLSVGDSLLERQECVPVHPQMGDHYAILNDFPVQQSAAVYLQGNMENAVVEAGNRGAIAENNRCSAIQNGLGNLDDWRLYQGFIGHDGLPRFFNPHSGEWDLSAPFGRAKVESN